ncbi:MAG: cytochrome c3 family protein, partial [Deltaproteobacteria bacterium]|nr:cytochrome c3 family protein [Deltaproteobacteria bacterium]
MGSMLLLLLLAGPAAAACVTGKCHAGLRSRPHPHEPVAAGDCLDCHQRQPGVSHPAPKGKTSFRLAAAGADLCYQCHDHFSGGPTVHEPVAEGDCLACHDVHGGTRPALMRVGEDGQPVCFSCHDPEPFAGKYSHGPAAAGACDRCHEPHAAANRQLLRRPARELCLGCHEELATGLGRAANVHQPLEKQSCQACHAVHSSAYPRLLTAAGPKLCFGCHQEVAADYRKAKTRHAALYQGDRCGNCHRPHYADQPALLAAAEEEVCLRCHGRDDHRRSRPLANIAREIKDKKFLHGPLKEGRCSACHRPHGSDNFRLLNGSYPASFYAPYRPGTYAFCLSCHEENLLRFPDTTIYTRFRNGNRNLHYVHVADPRKGRSCRACHRPHASDGPRLIDENGARFGDWRIPIRFVPTPTGGS